MTEIPIFPGGAPENPGEIAEPADGDFFGLFRGIHQHLARIGNNLPDPRRTRLEKGRAVWPVRVDPVPVPLVGGVGFLDAANLFGPGLGYNWDVHTISATGYTAGLVSGWINLPASALLAPTLQGALRAPFQAAGVLNWGKGQLWLRQGERITFVATGITGTVLVSLDGTSVADAYVGEYFL